MYYDYHIHSNFSPDSPTPMEDTVQAAIKKGLTEICFTDHMDLDYYVEGMVFEFDVNDYMKHIEKLRNQYGDSISIKTGIEMGIQPQIIERCEDIVKGNPFDFVISSLHTCGQKDLYNGDFYKGLNPRDAYKAYLLEMLYCAENFDSYNVLGHINLIKRYNDDVKTIDILDYKDILEALFNVLISKNKGFEINTSSLRTSDSLLLTKEVIEFYHQLGGRIITTGSDSHFPDTLSLGFDLVYDMLRSIGFEYITAFDKMQPKFIKL